MKEAVEQALEKLRPSLQADGTDVEVVQVDGKEVQLRLTSGPNACEECFLSADMLTPMFQQSIKKETQEEITVVMEDERYSTSSNESVK